MKNTPNVARILCFWLVCVLTPASAIAGPPTDMIHLHLSWVGDPQTMVAVTWWSAANYPGTVQYGLTTGYEVGSVTSTARTLTALTGYYHDATLTGLTPDTLYHYRVGDPTDGWSADHTFKTAPSNIAPFTFTAYGDQGTSSNSIATTNRIVATNPAFNLIAGDIAYDSMWTSWFNIMEPLAANIPTLVANGNHETETHVKELFQLPNNEKWFSFNYGNVHFIALRTDYDIAATTQNPEQLAWLEIDLITAAADPSRRWIIAFFHFPAYSYGTDHGGYPEVVGSFVPLFDRYHVDLAIAAHAHNYQRSYPMKGGAVVDRSPNSYNDPSGTIYMVVGTGGRSVRPLSTTIPAWAAYGEDTAVGFIKVTVNGSSLTVEQIHNADGQVHDSFTVTKQPPADTTPPAAPTGLKVLN